MTGAARPLREPADHVFEMIRLRALIEINRLIVSTADTGSLLALIVEKAAALVQADACALLLAGDDRRATVAAALGAGDAEAAAFSADLDERIGGPLRLLFGCTSGDELLSVPVLADGAIEGVLVACWRQPYRPHRDDEFLLPAIADQLAMALAHAASYRRRYRSERDAREAAERAVAVRDELLGMVSHDLRNPLAIVAMSATLLLREFPEQAPATWRTGAERIQRSVDRMLRLVDDLLQVTRVEAGTFAIDPAPHGAVALARDALNACHLSAIEKGIELRLHAPPAELRLLCDGARVMQVLVNLIGNAVKFTPTLGTIDLRVERDGDQALFSVADSGPGIPADELPRVFDRYWQGSRHGSHGSGLGLFIARSFVHAHGGRIWAESEVGVGSVFRFSLPLGTSI